MYRGDAPPSSFAWSFLGGEFDGDQAKKKKEAGVPQG